MKELSRFIKNIFDDEKREISQVYFGDEYEEARRSIGSNIIEGWRPTKEDVLKCKEILNLKNEEVVHIVLEYVNGE